MTIRLSCDGCGTDLTGKSTYTVSLKAIPTHEGLKAFHEPEKGVRKFKCVCVRCKNRLFEAVNTVSLREA